MSFLYSSVPIPCNPDGRTGVQTQRGHPATRGPRATAVCDRTQLSVTAATAARNQCEDILLRKPTPFAQGHRSHGPLRSTRPRDAARTSTLTLHLKDLLQRNGGTALRVEVYLNIAHDRAVLVVQEFHAHLGYGTPRTGAAEHQFNPSQLRTGVAKLILHPQPQPRQRRPGFQRSPSCRT